MTLPYFQIDTSNERLKTLANKHTAIWLEFNEKLDISWIYHDHGLEGTVLQSQEITIALSNKVISDNNFMPMYQEIKNMQAAIQFVREYAHGKKKGDRITRTTLQQLYGLLSHRLRGLPEGDGLRQEDGRYGAYYHKIKPFTEIDGQCKKVLYEANHTSHEDLHPIVQATRLHFQLMKLMPYGRFSGKISRLLSNLLLMRYGYPPTILHTVERAHYYEALAQDTEHDLLQLVLDGLNASVTGGLQYIEDELSARRRKREARKALRAQREAEKKAKAEAAKKEKDKKAKKDSKNKKTKDNKSAKTKGSKTTKTKTKTKTSSSTKKTASGQRLSAKKGTKTSPKANKPKTTSRKSTRSKAS